MRSIKSSVTSKFSLRLLARRVALIAGMAGFSPILDNVITNALRQILSTAIPDDMIGNSCSRLAIPYCPDPALFRYTVLDELNQGPLFWVYMGHGLHQELDQLVTPKGNYKIMELDDLEFVNCEESLPIMIFCACYTGAYDSTEMSIAEEFVLKPNGPIAVIARAVWRCRTGWRFSDSSFWKRRFSASRPLRI